MMMMLKMMIGYTQNVSMATSVPKIGAALETFNIAKMKLPLNYEAPRPKY